MRELEIVFDVTHVLSRDYNSKGLEWRLRGDPSNADEFNESFVVIKKNGVTPPTWDELQHKLKVMQAEYDSKQYQRDRKVEYDKLNQFEMQFDDQRDGTTTWVDAINGIKEKHPKE
jgi:hypothetical protein